MFQQLWLVPEADWRKFNFDVSDAIHGLAKFSAIPVTRNSGNILTWVVIMMPVEHPESERLIAMGNSLIVRLREIGYTFLPEEKRYSQDVEKLVPSDN
jgi:hypothetical protein